VSDAARRGQRRAGHRVVRSLPRRIPSNSARNGTRVAARAIRAVDSRAPQRSALRSLSRHDVAVPSHHSCAAPDRCSIAVTHREGNEHGMRPAPRPRPPSPSPSPWECCAKAAECARLRSGFTNTSVRGEPGPYGYRGALTNGRIMIGSPAAQRARQRKKIGADLRPYNPASRGNRDWPGERIACSRLLAQQIHNQSNRYQLGTRGGACERSCSTIKYS